MINFLRFACLFLTLCIARATYSNPEMDAFMKTIKCPTCQGQSIYDAPTEEAHAMRQAIQQAWDKGMREKDIKKRLIRQYGQSVLFDPPFNQSTWLLWVLPLIFLVIGVGRLGRMVLKNPLSSSDPKKDGSK